MNKWLKIGMVAGAISLGVLVLGLAAFVFLRPASVSASGIARMAPQSIMAERFNPGQNQFGKMNRFGNFGRPGRFGGQIDFDALLADALGITEEELQAAYSQAHQAGVQQALDEGLITQEEADQILARHQLRNYLDRDELTATALGITTEELQAARDEGKPLSVLIYELGLEPATVRTNMQAAFEAAIQQAVTDGVISQEQADEILNAPGRGFGPRGGFHHGRGGFGGFGWR